MFSLRAIKAIVAGFALLLSGWASGAYAQSATCGITGTASASGATYDPFNPAGLATATVTVTFTRKDPPGANGGKTAIVSFYLRSNNADADGTEVVPISVVGAVNNAYLPGENIFYDFSDPAPFMGPPTGTTNPAGANRYLKVEFTGNNEQSNPVTIQFNISLPANLNLNASTVLPFDAYYRCTTTGGGQPTDQEGFLGNAVTFPVTVLSALQATFSGTALDFGEIGTVTNAQALTTTTGVNNHIRVQSSGAYTVTLQSANAFRLKHPTGSLLNATERVDYQLKFLGVTRSNSTTPIANDIALTQTCARAGIGPAPAYEDRLYMLATLQEGGVGKTPGLTGNYSDTLTVTVTPQAIGVTYPTDCNGFTVP